MLLIIAFERVRNGISHDFEANTELQRDVPAPPRSFSCHGTARALTKTEGQFHGEILSAATFQNSPYVFCVKCQPAGQLSTPGRRTNAPNLGSFPPRERRRTTTLRLLCCDHATTHSSFTVADSRRDEYPCRSDHA